MMIYLIDMLNHVHVYEGMNMTEAINAKNDYMSFMGISDESIQMEVIYNDNLYSKAQRT